MKRDRGANTIQTVTELFIITDKGSDWRQIVHFENSIEMGLKSIWHSALAAPTDTVYNHYAGEVLR